ncbi:hypothetical protein Dimus_019825 [Dionaea muscipula]
MVLPGKQQLRKKTSTPPTGLGDRRSLVYGDRRLGGNLVDCEQLQKQKLALSSLKLLLESALRLRDSAERGGKESSEKEEGPPAMRGLPSSPVNQISNGDTGPVRLDVNVDL